jgi:hypothetical protein
MKFGHTGLSAVLSFVFIVSTMITGFTTSNAAAENAYYEGVKTGEFMKEWLLLGAIPVSEGGESPSEEVQREAFQRDFLAEYGGESGVQPEPDAAQKIDGNEYTWKIVRSRAEELVDLVDVYGKKEYVIAYAWAEIEVPEDTVALFGIGSDDAVKVWVNGELVHENWVGRAVAQDDDIIGVDLKAGKNSILLKVQNFAMDWGFMCRAIDPESMGDELILAVRMNDLDRIKTLTTHGVDLDVKDKSGLTALNAAKIHGKTGIIDFLLESGADADIPMPAPEQLLDFVFS